MRQQKLSSIITCLIRLQFALLIALVQVEAQDPIKITTSTIDLNVTTTTSAPSVTITPVAAATINSLNTTLESGTKKSSTVNSELGIAADLGTRSTTTTTAAPSSSAKSSVSVTTNTTDSPKDVVASFSTTTSKPSAQHEADKQQDKLDRYFAPICDSINKLTPKQLFKVQTQLKQFVEKTSGKLSVCFLQHFKIDPNLDPVSKIQLESICLSKKLAADAPDSFGAFKNCTSPHWDPQLDKLLDDISAARSSQQNNAFKVATNGTASASPVHDNESDEISLIGDVVSKVLEVNKDTVNKSDIKVIDITASDVATAASAASLVTTNAPKLSLLSSTTTIAPNASAKPSVASADLAIGNNATKVVVVEVVKTTTTDKPEIDMIADATTLSTAAPIADSPNTTLAPIEVQIEQDTTITTPGSTLTISSAGSTTTSAPVVTKILSTSNSTNKLVVEESKSTTVKPSSEKPSPTLAAATTIAPSKASSASTTGKPLLDKLVKAASEIKPLETIQDLLKRQEKQKQELEAKLKVEREKLLKQMKKKQDELDAKSAIKALQLQRSGSAGHQTSHSDARMHQIEHERQMSIDPIGHTIKHQQYEFNKQQRALKAGAAI